MPFNGIEGWLVVILGVVCSISGLEKTDVGLGGDVKKRRFKKCSVHDLRLIGKAEEVGDQRMWRSIISLPNHSVVTLAKWNSFRDSWLDT